MFFYIYLCIFRYIYVLRKIEMVVRDKEYIYSCKLKSESFFIFLFLNSVNIDLEETQGTW